MENAHVQFIFNSWEVSENERVSAAQDISFPMSNIKWINILQSIFQDMWSFQTFEIFVRDSVDK